ncbi:hypothetical protein C8D88_102780 [Lentzea atacamensis]|uniref:Uncharacterized protein n=1 Tax=Lentzea atacamensis TaxID=531938 RepID=A0A316IAL4_9PSEU|nr:permease prefix domain 1-containing protein [Lentzea atacamensis]PWK89506.1 hypothetical protein C8D88_102780 [Lentzea atacamensis]
MARDVLIIDTYLAALAARLPGPRRAREAVLDELRDGITEAMSRRADIGLRPAAAAEAALAEFGTVDEVATAFAGELATRQARQVILALMLTGPLVGVWWLLLLAPRSPVGIPALPLIGAAVLTGLIALATTGQLTRWLPAAPPDFAVTAATAVAGACVVGDVTMLVGFAAHTPAVVGWTAVIAVAASLFRIACCTYLLRGCLTTSRVLRSR